MLLDPNGDPIPTCGLCRMRVMRVVEGSCWPPPCLLMCPDCDRAPWPDDPPAEPTARPHN